VNDSSPTQTQPSVEIAVPDVSEKTSLERIQDGELALIEFDSCDRNQDLESYEPENDALGVFICGETYSIQYNEVGSVWVGVGPDENLGANSDTEDLVSKRNEWQGPGPLEGAGNVYLWGVRLKVGEDGSLKNTSGEYVGMLGFQ